MIITEARLKQIIKEEIQKRYAEIDDVLLERLIEESRINGKSHCCWWSFSFNWLYRQIVAVKTIRIFRERMLAQMQRLPQTSKSDRMLWLTGREHLLILLLGLGPMMKKSDYKNI